jgi:hypothetical protein
MWRLFAWLVLGCALAQCVAVRAQDRDAGQAIYRYLDSKGHAVYTNIVEQVPVRQRATAWVDLSRVSLNTEVGTEIDRRFEEQHAALTKSPYCQHLRAAANAGFFARLWEDFAPLVACGAMLLVLLLFTPTALRRFGAPVWAKVLTMAIPSLTLAGLMMFSMSYTTKTLSELKRRAKPCSSEFFVKLANREDALVQHAQLVEQLKHEIAELSPEGR